MRVVSNHTVIVEVPIPLMVSVTVDRDTGRKMTVQATSNTSPEDALKKIRYLLSGMELRISPMGETE